MKKAWKKIHKWPGIIVSFLLLYYGISGIFMNHRETFARWDIKRSLLPAAYQYNNWNNAALKGNLIVDADSMLVYGNLGVYSCDSSFQNFRALNTGFGRGTDRHKVFDLHRSTNGDLFAATQFGMFVFNRQKSVWEKLEMDGKSSRFVGITEKADTIYAINRSYLFKGASNGVNSHFEKIELSQPLGYQNKVSLFKTMWQIHSGEILGLPGRLVVDALGLITIFLSITGLIYFFFPKWIKRRKKKQKDVSSLAQANRWSLKWHNHFGAWIFIPLMVLFFTGMFLRPPILIAIVNSKVKPIQFSHLDQPNAWYDKLRDIIYDTENDRFLLSTLDGMCAFTEEDFRPQFFENQPPVSVMGINVLQPYANGSYLVGSFAGLFLWHPNQSTVYDFVQGKPHHGSIGGRPVGLVKASGLLKNTKGKPFLVEYDKGVIPLWHNTGFPEMPEQIIAQAKMSLWNVSLELHTGRIFSNLIGMFYILLVPLSGLVAVLVTLSGYMVYRKKRRNR